MAGSNTYSKKEEILNGNFVLDTIEEAISNTLCELQLVAHGTAKDKGFSNDCKEHVGIGISLMHSELSELLEAYRHGNPLSEKIAGFSEAEEELADLFIRALHFAEKHNLDLGAAIIAKMRYNLTREHMHGKRF